MKWVLGGLFLAVVASVMSGRVPVAWVVYSFGALFIFMGMALFFAFTRNKHHGLLLLGFTYVLAAIAAIVLTEWWPLVAGFVIAWVMRAMGIEPTPAELPDAQTQAPAQMPPPESDKKG